MPFNKNMLGLMISLHLNAPDSFRFSVAIALSATYDYEPCLQHNLIVSIVYNFLRVAIPALAPAKILLIDVFPFHECLWLNEEDNSAQIIW